MKTILYLFSSIYLIGCCSVKETTTSNTTFKDSTLTQEPKVETIYVQDEDNAFKNWAYESIEVYQRIIDSLNAKLADSLKIHSPGKPKPFRGEWKISKVTLRGDSIWIEFKYDNGKGTFFFKEIPAPINIQIPHTETTTTIEKEKSWIETAWTDFKDYILVLLLILVAGYAIFQRVKLNRIL